MAESSGRADAANWNDVHHNCTGSFSLMQVGCFWYQFYGYTIDEWYNPEVNMEIAYKIYLRSGNSFYQWSTCKLIEGCR